jgi:hypothetical protein
MNEKFGFNLKLAIDVRVNVHTMIKFGAPA